MSFQVYEANSGKLVFQSEDAKIIDQYGYCLGVHPRCVQYIEESLLDAEHSYRILWNSGSTQITTLANYAGKQWDCHLFMN